MAPPAPPGELFGRRTPMFAGGATGNEKSICVVVSLLRFFRRAFLTRVDKQKEKREQFRKTMVDVTTEGTQ